MYDETHKMVLVHEARKHWIILIDEEMEIEKVKKYSQTEKMFETLWRDFCKTISIQERENKELQRQHLPIWYRGNMVEFTK